MSRSRDGCGEAFLTALTVKTGGSPPTPLIFIVLYKTLFSELGQLGIGFLCYENATARDGEF